MKDLLNHIGSVDHHMELTEIQQSSWIIST